MIADQVLSGLALLEIARKAGPDTLGDFLNVAGAECDHVGSSVYLCGLLLEVAKDTGYDLDRLIAAHRATAIAMQAEGMP